MTVPAPHRRPPPVPTYALPGARFSRTSVVVLVGCVAAALATVYGAREDPLSDLSVEVVFAAAVAALVVAPIPVALALAGRRAGMIGLIIALLSAGAGAIHYAVIREHFDEYWLYGVFFVGMALFQLVWAVGVVARPSCFLYSIGALGNTLIVV